MVNKFFKSIFGAVILLGISATTVFAATITVSPGESIQTKCLNVVKSGDTCIVNPGTYSETLTFKSTNTSPTSSEIIVKCATTKSCTVNSGSSQLTLKNEGNINHYTIDGFNFISVYNASNQDEYNIYIANSTANSSNTFKNNYVEGGMKIVGTKNLVENNEFNGKNKWVIGIYERDAVSHDNTYRSNTIHDYATTNGRGIWSMDSTKNTTIDGNTIYNVKNGVNCDGAARPVNCYLTNNHTYSTSNAGLFLEDCFNCVVQGNFIDSTSGGFGIFSQNYGNGSTMDNNWHTPDGVEHRDGDTNQVIKNNVFKFTDSAIYVYTVNGMQIDHNTFYSTSPTWETLKFKTDTGDGGVIYKPINETITNNIFLPNSKGDVVWVGYTTTGLVNSGNYYGNPGFTNVTEPASSNFFRLSSTSSACSAGAFPCNLVGSPASKVGDINNDGSVNVIDIGILIDTYGKGVSLYPKSDVNGDGVININDIGVVIDNYGK